MRTAFLVALALTGLSLQALAEGEPNGSKHPCQQIKESCSAAGFTVGGHKHHQDKGLYKDCMQPILEGKTVAGVNVSSDLVASCKAKKEERAAKKGK